MVWTESGPTKRIVKANMDGTTIKEVATEIGTLSDIAIDHYTAGNKNLHIYLVTRIFYRQTYSNTVLSKMYSVSSSFYLTVFY